MAISQYTGTLSNPSADIQNVVANNVGMLDKYILMQTGEYEYKAIIKDLPLNDITVLTFTRSSGTYSNVWSCSHTKTSDFSYTVRNEMYVYSNMNIGKSLDLPVYKGMTAYSLCIIVSVLSLAVLFKGVLFKWLRKR